VVISSWQFIARPVSPRILTAASIALSFGGGKMAAVVKLACASLAGGVLAYGPQIPHLKGHAEALLHRPQLDADAIDFPPVRAAHMWPSKPQNHLRDKIIFKPLWPRASQRVTAKNRTPHLAAFGSYWQEKRYFVQSRFLELNTSVSIACATFSHLSILHTS
jgi:hypothetical protein